ncbi:acyl-coenzyme A thioesterase THEM5 isoform X1 [Orcinus orca]|uniref:acyl-coenzyme A thioesterase THEM5 isoform X1 n=1 Tax=Orcinus orca TaxID=9733 RepID=UPI001442485F|nr:acyl-coenzyme A thioesterase THEM5 isoform X1 [Orcinus orca]
MQPKKCTTRLAAAALPTRSQRSAMMRRGLQVAARPSHHGALPGGPYILPTFSPASAFGSSMDSLVSRFCQEKTDLKNYTLPNASWCPDMLNLYHKFLEKTKADGWIRLPSFKSNRNHIQGLKLPLVLTVSSDKSDCHIFTRCTETEGQSYEYVIFFHPSKKKSVCLFQPGPYLEGPPGFAHGGSLAAMIDETFSKTAYLAGEGLFTHNLNIRFKNLIRMGSLAVLNVGMEKVEDQKLYISCVAQSTDQQTIYTKASGRESLSPRPCPATPTPRTNRRGMLRIQSQAGVQLFRVGLGTCRRHRQSEGKPN